MIIFRILGALIFVGCMAVLYRFEQSDSALLGMRMIHWPAILLTGIGPCGIILLSYDSRSIMEAIRLVLRHSTRRQRKLNAADRELISTLGIRYYTEGSRALEEAMQSESSSELSRTLKRLLAKMPVSDVLSLYQKEHDSVEARFEQNQEIFGLGGRMAPSIGMLGTILGMVQLLGSLEDPSRIGSHMSVALLTTFFGLFFSLLIWTPLQQKVASSMSMESAGFEQIQHWLELLEKRKPIHYFSESEIKGG